MISREHRELRRPQVATGSSTGSHGFALVEALVVGTVALLVVQAAWSVAAAQSAVASKVVASAEELDQTRLIRHLLSVEVASAVGHDDRSIGSGELHLRAFRARRLRVRRRSQLQAGLWRRMGTARRTATRTRYLSSRPTVAGVHPPSSTAPAPVPATASHWRGSPRRSGTSTRLGQRLSPASTSRGGATGFPVVRSATWRGAAGSR